MNNFRKTGFYIALYGVAIILIWIGIFKFTPTEAKAIQPLVSHSPFMSWMYRVWSLEAVSKIIGTIEIITGVLLALQPVSKRAGFVGGVFSTITFLLTISFIFSTPAIMHVDGVYLPDPFLLKDVMALGISIYTAAVSAEALNLNLRIKNNMSVFA